MIASALLCPGLCDGAPAAEGAASEVEFGADYYAEDWPPERTETDARLKQQAGFRTVHLVDTNWERLEPSKGSYDFAWLERVIEILNRHSVRAILGTSTYVPPAWLIEKHPNFYAVNQDGVRYRWGGMGFMCLNHPLHLINPNSLVGRGFLSSGGRLEGAIDPAACG